MTTSQYKVLRTLARTGRDSFQPLDRSLAASAVPLVRLGLVRRSWRTRGQSVYAITDAGLDVLAEGN